MDYKLPGYHPSTDLAERIQEIQSAINKLNSLRDRGISEELKRKIYQQVKISHIYNSNAIEGNSLSLRETELIINSLEVNERLLKDQLEAKTLSEAYDFLFDLISGKQKINRHEILDIHSMLMKKVNSEISGKFRNDDVSIGGAAHVPPSWADVSDHIDAMLRWYANDNAYSVLVKAAVFHHWFVWIHPFVDGNGRTSRLLLNFFLIQNGYPEVVIRLENRDEYYKSLAAADSGDITPLVDLLSARLFETAALYEEYIYEEQREKLWLKKYTFEQAEIKKETERYNYEVFRSQIEVFYSRFDQLVKSLTDRLREVRISVRYYQMISASQYIDILEGSPISNTWYFTVRFSEPHKDDILAIFYFTRLYPRLKNYLGTRPRSPKPYVKLNYSLRRKGDQITVDDRIRFASVGVKKDRLIFGLRDPEKPKYIVNSESLPGDIIRGFIDDIVGLYFS